MRRYICFLYSFLLLGTTARAQKIIVLDSLSKKQIGKELSFYIPGKEVGFQEALNAAYTPSQRTVPNLGILPNSVWMKFSLLNRGGDKSYALYLDNPTFDEAEFFFQKAPGAVYQRLLINKDLPLSSRKYKGSDFIFRLDVRDTQLQTYYLRVKSKQPIILPINLNTPADQLIQTIQKNWLNGIYFGMILIMAIYNFFLFLSIKDRSYLYYVIFILSAGLTQIILKGLGFQYFWPGSPFIENHSMIFFAALSGITALQFTRHFLDIRHNFPILNRLILIFMLPFAVCLGFLFFGNIHSAFLIMRSNTGLSSFVILFTSIIVLKKRGNVSALYFVASWSFLIAGSLIYIFNNYGILPYNTFTNYSVQLSSAIEMTLLSFALASRINILKKEKEISRLTALKLAYENERIVKQQNLFLEEQVAKRTEELKHKNRILNQTYEDLKQTQSQLVAAEKMSSLGQLTAGIAHEINNPINFVAGNITPLKRDVNQLFDAIAKIEFISGQEMLPISRKMKIEAFKAEQDFDYLKTEISYLLKGIQEGASRTADIVRGLRIFSRLDEDNLKNADINEGLRSTLAISNNLLNGIQVELNLGDIPPINCYPGKLNQVFLNIITNGAYAIHQKFRDAREGRLSIKTYAAYSSIYISIKDNGTGMDEAVKARLFEPFFTTKKVGEGTGLGMSIAFTIIEQHQGALTIHSEPGIGSEFLLRLPLLHSEEKADPGIASAKEERDTIEGS